MAANTIYKGVHTHGWARWEQADTWVFQGFLNGNLWKNPKKKPEYLLNGILKINGLHGDFDIIKWDSTSIPNGVFVSFKPTGPLIEQLSNMKWLNTGVGKLFLKKQLQKACLGSVV